MRKSGENEPALPDGYPVHERELPDWIDIQRMLEEYRTPRGAGIENKINTGDVANFLANAIRQFIKGNP